MEQLTPRRVEPEDWLRFEQSMAEDSWPFGLNLETPRDRRTPERFLKALCDATAGHERDHKPLTAFPTECRCDDDCLACQVTERPISFHTVGGDRARRLGGR